MRLDAALLVLLEKSWCVGHAGERVWIAEMASRGSQRPWKSGMEKGGELPLRAAWTAAMTQVCALAVSTVPPHTTLTAQLPVSLRNTTACM